MTAQPPRPSVPRSSFAAALKDYTFIRPGIAVSISAACLIAALVIGIFLIGSLKRATAIVDVARRTVFTLHGYNAALETWQQLVVTEDPELKKPESGSLRNAWGVGSGSAGWRRSVRSPGSETAGAPFLHVGIDPIDQLVVQERIEPLHLFALRSSVDDHAERVGRDATLGRDRKQEVRRLETPGRVVTMAAGAIDLVILPPLVHGLRDREVVRHGIALLSWKRRGGGACHDERAELDNRDPD